MPLGGKPQSEIFTQNYFDQFPDVMAIDQASSQAQGI
jgi:hypothetical protein